MGVPNEDLKPGENETSVDVYDRKMGQYNDPVVKLTPERLFPMKQNPMAPAPSPFKLKG